MAGLTSAEYAAEVREFLAQVPEEQLPFYRSWCVPSPSDVSAQCASLVFLVPLPTFRPWQVEVTRIPRSRTLPHPAAWYYPIFPWYPWDPLSTLPRPLVWPPHASKVKTPFKYATIASEKINTLPPVVMALVLRFLNLP